MTQQTDGRPELTVVMPVYNEEECIEEVLRKWVRKLRKMNVQFRIMALDDGSRDDTPRILDRLTPEIPELQVIHKPNSGHGPTVWQGYERAESGWVLQIDSDDEIAPGEFPKLWNARIDADFVIGRRLHRQAPLVRRMITRLESLLIMALFGGRVRDVNIPFRLIRWGPLRRILRAVPSDAFAPNVLMTALAYRHRLQVHEVPVVHEGRATGEVSIKKWKLLKACMRAFADLLALGLRLPRVRSSLNRR